jgi:hypothetical protein
LEADVALEFPIVGLSNLLVSYYERSHTSVLQTGPSQHFSKGMDIATTL